MSDETTRDPSGDDSSNQNANGRPARKPSGRRRLLGWTVRIAVFIGIFVGVSQWQQSDLLPLGQAAPRFELQTLEGETVHLSNYQGKPVLLHFWATWCGVCRQEFSMLNTLQESLGDDAVLLSVVADGEVDELRTFADAHGLRYPILRATRSLLKQYRIGAFPTNYFLDADGKVKSRSVGLSTAWAMRARMSCAR